MQWNCSEVKKKYGKSKSEIERKRILRTSYPTPLPPHFHDLRFSTFLVFLLYVEIVAYSSFSTLIIIYRNIRAFSFKERVDARMFYKQ